MSTPTPAKDATPAHWILMLAMLAIGMGQTVVLTVLPMLGRQLELHKLVVSLPWGTQWMPRELAITSLSALTALLISLVAPMWGRLSDRVGRKPVLIAGMLGYGAGSLLFNSALYAGLSGLLSGIALYLALLLTRLTQATVMSAAQPAAGAYMADITSATTRTRGISSLASALQIGTMTGPALAYFTFYSFLAPLFLQATMCLVCAFMIWRFVPEPQQHRTHTTSGAAGGTKKLGYLDPRYRFYILVSLVTNIGLAMVQQTLGFYFQDTLQLDSMDATRRFSYAVMFSSSCMLTAQFFIVQRLSLTPQALLRLGLPLCSIGFGTLALSDSQWLLLAGMGLFGVGIGVAGPGYNAGATMHVEPHEQGALAGLAGSSAGFGFVTGSLLGGSLYHLSSELPLAIAALLLVPLIIFSWRAK